MNPSPTQRDSQPLNPQLQLPPPYPFIFRPVLKEKVWGGLALEKLGKALPRHPDGRPKNTGESWELVDLGKTSVSGGGGGAERSEVANGPLAGKTLAELIRGYGRSLMGRLELTPEGGFPILIKFLDARENLSVQVHPSEVYASTHPDAFLKSEAWYILHAEPGAAIYKGVKPGVSPQEFRKAALGGNLEELLIKVPVKAGDCHYLPSGTCHALGGGILVAEVQTPSDTTFRVYDWGRTDRELHLDQAIECIHFGPAETARYEQRTHIAGIFTTVTRLVECEHFRIEKVRMSEGYAQEIPYSQPAVWMVLEGQGEIKPRQHAHPIAFSKGQTLLIPADMPQATVSFKKDTAWLEVTFPQALSNLIA